MSLPRAENLNERQRAYLLAIFSVDQAMETEMRSIPYRPFQPRPKASECRWLEYSEPVPEIQKPASRLYEAIKQASKLDQGSGSTFDALAARGLVEVRWGEYNVHGQRKPYLRLTTAGRRLCRARTGQKAYKAPPAGTLREWHWRALAKAYAAGDDGLAGSYGDYANIGWQTWLRLRDYKRSALVEERESGWYSNPASGSLGRVFQLHITAAGRALYKGEWTRYRELYPDVEAPTPATVAAGADR